VNEIRVKRCGVLLEESVTRVSQGSPGNQGETVDFPTLAISLPQNATRSDSASKFWPATELLQADEKKSEILRSRPPTASV
jgi:hypothetical protein